MSPCQLRQLLIYRTPTLHLRREAKQIFNSLQRTNLFTTDAPLMSRLYFKAGPQPVSSCCLPLPSLLFALQHSSNGKRIGSMESDSNLRECCADSYLFNCNQLRAFALIINKYDPIIQRRIVRKEIINHWLDMQYPYSI